jgi:hypothetical protein
MEDGLRTSDRRQPDWSYVGAKTGTAKSTFTSSPHDLASVCEQTERSTVNAFGSLFLSK